MKVFRDIFGAILLGIMGGVIVSTLSYYCEHREGGVKQTLFAVVDSFDKISKAYSTVDENGMPIDNMTLDDKILEAFEQVENGEEPNLTNEFLKSDLLVNEDIEQSDILAVEGEDGKLDEGAPYTGILRFHVRANSDSKEDQELKLAVKEDIVSFLKPLLEDCKDVKESRKIIVKNLRNIYITALDTIIEQGYDYDVKVYLTEEEFPVKTYGDLTFPAGKYQALRVDIGEAKGQNWWCVMYPPLCFIDESTVVVSEEGKEKLKASLTIEEYRNLLKGSMKEEDKPIKIKGESWLYNFIMKR